MRNKPQRRGTDHEERIKAHIDRVQADLKQQREDAHRLAQKVSDH